MSSARESEIDQNNMSRSIGDNQQDKMMFTEPDDPNDNSMHNSMW
jgi:hypothetical protein